MSSLTCKAFFYYYYNYTGVLVPLVPKTLRSDSKKTKKNTTTTVLLLGIIQKQSS